MMHKIASHAAENRMTSSAVATCMAPLLLRPLLAGECELDDDYDTNGDNSAQFLAAANAANSAAAIATILLEEYENIFDVRFIYLSTKHFYKCITNILACIGVMNHGLCNVMFSLS